MKIDRVKLKKSSTDVPTECRALIEKIKSCSEDDLLVELKQIRNWTFGKCELYHWADVLDVFDGVLGAACAPVGGGAAPTEGSTTTSSCWTLSCDVAGNERAKQLLLHVLHFTALLIEHSFTRHLYNSMAHLSTLLASSDMTVVLAVLNLLYVFSKRSNFITRLSAEKKQGVVQRLTHLAESWGGKENGFGLAECCQDLPTQSYPSSATTLHFEFYAENKDKGGKKKFTNVLSSIHVENVDNIPKLAAEIMQDLLYQHNVPENKQMLLFTHIRLAHSFSDCDKRIQCVQARLQAISILVYSNAIQENVKTLLYNGFIEELVDILELKTDKLMEIKAAALRTMTSIIHLERNPKLNNIIDATGASAYHGFLPVLVRTCIQHMIDPELQSFPQPFATALFSFLYHLASYDSGAEALVSCGMMESLLKVIHWFGEGQDHITFVTRAVRVVDLITNLDMQAFQAHTGLTSFILRLEHEVELCRKEQPFVIEPVHSDTTIGAMPASPSADNQSTQPASTEQTDRSGQSHLAVASTSTASIQGSVPMDGVSTDGGQRSASSIGEVAKTADGKSLQCFPQRAALLKSMLNFLKKAIPDPAFSESIRHLMDGSLPRSLKHIISNAEYYGPPLFLLATDVVTVYVFQEPSLLSSLQDNGLTDVVLHALLVKDVPATREVLASLPNMFNALCLNARGLQAFVQCKPFDCLFKVLLSPEYLPAMRRRRSSDPPGDTASNLGSAMDELMRHQPSLRVETTRAIIKLLEEVCSMGRDPRYVCNKTQVKAEPLATPNMRANIGNEAASSDDEEDEDEVASTHSGVVVKSDVQLASDNGPAASQERISVPLVDYVLNVMKFVEAILSNNTTDDHCREFVNQKGLLPLLGILGLPNLPVDFPTSPSCQSVALVCKAILTLSHEPQVLRQGLLQLNDVLQSLQPLHDILPAPGGSVLLRELTTASTPNDPTLSAHATPLLHALAAAHAYITTFTHVCKVGQSDVRSISVSHWGSELGLLVLQGLSKLYTSLVWESTVLLAFCSDDILPAGTEFGRADLDRLLPAVNRDDAAADAADASSLKRSTGDIGSNGVSAAMKSLSTSEPAGATSAAMSGGPTPMEAEDSASSDKKSRASAGLQAQVRQIKPLLSASSRLGRALAELFGLLVKLCVGTPVRQRRGQLQPSPAAPTPAARAVATALTRLLANGLSWMPPPYSPVPKLRLTFFICSVGFTSPMLFDEKKFPYYLMLQKFLSSGGQRALFEAFHWALSCGGKVPVEEGLENEELPDGTGEFLDAWLMLIEKMVNTKNVLESPHTLPAKSTQPGFVQFDPLQYLIHTHKEVFRTVMALWNKKPLKVYGGRMSESVLAILCHIIKGESVIKERLSKENETATKKSGVPVPASAAATTSTPVTGRAAALLAANSSTGGASTSNENAASLVLSMIDRVITEPTVNQDHLQQLMDMGFTSEHASEALRQTTTLEQATEFLLTHPPAAPSANAPQSFRMEMDLSEDDQMMRAIAMSLGENVLVSTEQSEQAQKKAKTEQTDVSEDDTQLPEPPLEKDVLDAFTETMMTGCLRLLDELPETVYRVCDMIVVVTNRNGEKWRDATITSLVTEIAQLCLTLVQAAAPLTTSDNTSVAEWANRLSTLPDAARLAARLHLLSLMFDEMQLACALAVQQSGVLDLLIRLLDASQQCLAASSAAGETTVSTPKWLAPLLILLDLYEKVAVSSQRKKQLKAVVGESHCWKWFDDRFGKWCNYSNGNNKTIDDAYRAGESSVRFTAGRRRYRVQFGSMVQINEETANRRPLMLSLPSRDEKEATSKNNLKKDAKSEDGVSATQSDADNKMEMEDASKDEDEKDKDPDVKQMWPDHITDIIRCCVSLLSIPVEPDTLHALMRLCLRVTREHSYALQFARLGGVRHLLALRLSSSFQGFTSLATLLLRHVLEEPATLKHTMEKVVRCATAGAGSGLNGVAQGSLGSKEMHYVLRVLGPATCRSPSLFLDVVKSNLRIALPPQTNRDEDDSRPISSSSAQIVKCVSSRTTGGATIPVLEDHVQEVLEQLLNALIQPLPCNAQGEVVQPSIPTIQDIVNEISQRAPSTSVSSTRRQIVRQNSASDLQSHNEIESVTAVASCDEWQTGLLAEDGGSTATASKSKTLNEEDQQRQQQALLPKSGILRLLAELIKSYAGCALLVTQHVYPAGLTELVTEECSMLAFLLDQLLPSCQEAGDRDCPALARVVVASIAASSHNTEAQATLASELKSALGRALALPECPDKHARVQALAGLIASVIDACPSPPGTSTANSMVRLLLRRGLVSDLARIAHSLDLSSPLMPVTVNAALKPLETLCRIVNQPQAVNTGRNTRAAKDTAHTDTVVTSQQQDTVNQAAEWPAEDRPVDETRTEDVGAEVDHMDETNTPLDAVMPEEETHEQQEEEEEAEQHLNQQLLLEQMLQQHEQIDDALDEAERHTTQQVLGEIVMDTNDESEAADSGRVVIDVEIEADLDDDVHDSQMVTQDIYEDEIDDTVHEDENDSEADDEDDDHEVADEEDDEGDDDDEDEDEDEGSDMEAEDEFDFGTIDDNPYNMDDDSELQIQLQEMLTSSVGNGTRAVSGGNLMFADSSTQIQSFQLPIALPSTGLSHDLLGSVVPPAPINVSANHPLLVRQPEPAGVSTAVAGGTMAARVHRAGRQRGGYRYTGTPGRQQTVLVQYGGGTSRHVVPPPPAILQRLLGPSASNVLHMTNTLVSGSHPRFQLVMTDDIRMSSRLDNDIFDDLFQDSFLDGEGTGSGVLANVPSALSRWTEEARVLDADSMHDCITVLEPEIVSHLEKTRDAELAERREKRRKTDGANKETVAPAAAVAAKSGGTLVSTGGAWATPPSAAPLQVSERHEQISVPSTISEPAQPTLPDSLLPASLIPPSAAPRALASSSIVTSQSLAEVIATAIVVDAQGTSTSAPVTTTANPVAEPAISEVICEAPAVTPATAPSLFSALFADSPSPPRRLAVGADQRTIPQPTQTPMETGSYSENNEWTQPDWSQLEGMLQQTQPSVEQRSLTPVLDAALDLSETPASSQPLTVTSSSSTAEQTPQAAGSSMAQGGTDTSTAAKDEASANKGTASGLTAVTTTTTTSNRAVSTAADTTAAVTTLATAVSSTVRTTTTTIAASGSASAARPATESGLPDGVDPSFLAALPESIRQEVIGEQLRLQRIQQRAQAQQVQAQTLGVGEVNPEFLAALPPSIQEEVLAQQRAEQARLAAQSASTSEASDAPVDPACFIQSLPPSLRQQVLADMDDSMVAILPAELAAEASVLRHELEERHQRLMQERLFAQGSGPLSAALRHSVLAGRLGPARFVRPPHGRGIQWGWSRTQQSGAAPSTRPGGSTAAGVRLRGRHLLDHEALTCLLVLLFIDEPKMNTSRLHRVLRNLCYHAATRAWVVQALLSILQRTGRVADTETALCNDCAGQLSWLSISLDAALGCRSNVFQVQRSGCGKRHAACPNVTIHPQAAPLICRHVLDTLISLARSFPAQFLPETTRSPTEDKQSKPTTRTDTDFWELLVRLDGMGGMRKSKMVARGAQCAVTETSVSLQASFEASALAQLMDMLAHPVVRRSQLLTDRLLRLLALVSVGLPDMTQPATTSSNNTNTVNVMPAVASSATDAAAVSTVQASSTSSLSYPSASSNVTVTAVLPSNVSAIQSCNIVPASHASHMAAVSCSTSQIVCSAALPGQLPVVASQPMVVCTPAPVATAVPAGTAVSGGAAVSGSMEPNDNSLLVTDEPAQDDTLVFSETMEMSSIPDEYLTSTPLPKKHFDDGKATKKAAEAECNENAVLEMQLHLAVQVLTSKSCSEEGLEDATNLLLQLSRANGATRDRVLMLLLTGARQLALTVCTHIRALLQELQQLNLTLKTQIKDQETEDALNSVAQPKGVMPDRFQGGNVVIHCATDGKSSGGGGRELQLPSMAALTHKTSSQHFFLRTLKAIIQLREAARAAAKKAQKAADGNDTLNASEAMAEAMAYWQAESDAIIERLRRRDNTQQGAPPAAAGESTAGTSEESRQETPMEMDPPGVSRRLARTEALVLPRLSDQLQLDELWDALGSCLVQLANTPDQHAVLLLQPTVEAFFLVHAGEKDEKKKESTAPRTEDQLSHLNVDEMAPLSPAPSSSDAAYSGLVCDNSAVSVNSTVLPPDTVKFLRFAERHQMVLNQILRQSTAALADGPFSVLVEHTRVLDFDVKRRYFRRELERREEGLRREDLAVPVRRMHVFEDSYRELQRRTADEWKHRFYIVFEGEEGQDAGGLLREWYLIMSREIFNPMYALFMTSPGDRVTYTINPSSHCNSNHLSYFKFVGRVIAKAIYDNKLLECYFTRSFYKHILGVLVKYTDMESEDYAFYQGLVFLLENDVKDLGYELTFSTEIQEFGVTEVRDMKENGRNVHVTEANKKEYVKLVCQMKMTGAIRKQINAFLDGFYDIIPKRLISIFNEQELELLISGLPTIDIDDLKSNTEYYKYQPNSLQIQWFWRALRSFDQADRARLLQFVTGTSKVPLQGFAFLEGMTGIQKFQIHRDDRSTDRLPSAHTCFNQLDLPAYETFDKLKMMMLTAIHECSEGFGLA